MRNVCDALIGARLNEGIEPERNGEAWLVRAVAPRAQAAIDVGANIGVWTRLFLAHAPGVSRVLLLEPSDLAYRELERVFDGDARVTCLNTAVSDTAGTGRFFEEPSAGETSSLLQAHSRRDARSTEVDVTTLDALLEQHSMPRVDFVKIDAEGYDGRVLRGGESALAEHRLGIVQFEYNRPWALAGETLAGALSLLHSHAYRVFLLRSSGLHEFEYERYGEFLSYANFVAVAPESLDVLAPHVREPR